MNRALRDRAILPVAIPLSAIGLIAGVVFLFSRVLLTIPKFVAVFVALFVATNILIVCSVLAVRKMRSATDLAPLFAVAAVPVLLGAAIATGFIEVAGEEKHEAGPIVVEISAANLAFNKTEIKLTAGKKTVIRFNNTEATSHNLAIYKGADAAEAIFKGDIFGGPGTRDYSFDAPGPGEYFFRCDVHPNMNGKVVVTEGAGEEQKAVKLAASNLAFDKKELSLPADSEVTVEFNNKETTSHNFAAYTSQDATQAIFKGAIFAGPATKRYGFKTPAKGTYFFRCDVHPTTMLGTLKVG